MASSLASLAERPLVARLVASLLFALLAAAFVLPAISVAVDERRAEASGLELAFGDPDLSGRYVHAAYEGEVESFVADLGGPARGAFVCALAALALVWLPGRAGPATGAGLTALALLGLLLFYLTTTSGFDLVDAELRLGYPVLVVAALAALAWCSLAAARALFWWRPQPPPERDYFRP